MAVFDVTEMCSKQLANKVVECLTPIVTNINPNTVAVPSL